MFGQLGADVRADVAHEFTLPDPLVWLKITSYPFTCSGKNKTIIWFTFKFQLHNGRKQRSVFRHLNLFHLCLGIQWIEKKKEFYFHMY